MGGRGTRTRRRIENTLPIPHTSPLYFRHCQDFHPTTRHNHDIRWCKLRRLASKYERRGSSRWHTDCIDDPFRFRRLWGFHHYFLKGEMRSVGPTRATIVPAHSFAPSPPPPPLPIGDNAYTPTLAFPFQFKHDWNVPFCRSLQSEKKKVRWWCG
jgi:hypothetical protein